MGYGGSYGGEEARCKRRGGEKWGQRALAWEMGWVLGLSVPGHTEQVPDAVLGLAGWAGTGCVGTRKHGTGVRVKVPGYGAVLGLRWELGRGPGLPEPGSAVRVSGRWAHGWRAGSVPLRAVPVPLSGRCAGRSRQWRSAPPPPSGAQRGAPGAARPRCGTRRRPWGVGSGTDTAAPAGAPGVVSGAGPGGVRSSPSAEHGIGSGTGTGTGRGGVPSAGGPGAWRGSRTWEWGCLRRGGIQGDAEHGVRRGHILRCVGVGRWVPGRPQPRWPRSPPHPPPIPLCVQGARPTPPCDPRAPRPPQLRGIKMLVSTAGMDGTNPQRCGAVRPDTRGAATPGGQPLGPAAGTEWNPRGSPPHAWAPAACGK